MSSYGFTPDHIDRMLGATFANTPLAISQICAKIHNGAPGVGLTNPSQVVARSQVNFTTPSGGSTGLDTGAASFTMDLSSPSTETIQGVSLWDGFETDVDSQCICTGQANPPVPVADGDVVILNLYDIDTLGMAS